MKKIVGIAVIILVAVGIFVFVRQQPQQQACTTEAKVCPDGSSVGRTGPNCEFAACPVDAADSSFASLYYYNPAKDVDAQGNVLCSAKGLVPVPTIIPKDVAQINPVIRALIAGSLTEEQRAQGITTEFPLKGFVFLGSGMFDDTMNVNFDDPNHLTSGGACRVAVLRAQIEATVKQFPGITHVVINPQELFQP